MDGIDDSSRNLGGIVRTVLFAGLIGGLGFGAYKGCQAFDRYTLEKGRQAKVEKAIESNNIGNANRVIKEYTERGEEPPEELVLHVKELKDKQHNDFLATYDEKLDEAMLDCSVAKRMKRKAKNFRDDLPSSQNNSSDVQVLNFAVQSHSDIEIALHTCKFGSGQSLSIDEMITNLDELKELYEPTEAEFASFIVDPVYSRAQKIFSESMNAVSRKIEKGNLNSRDLNFLAREYNEFTQLRASVTKLGRTLDSFQKTGVPKDLSNKYDEFLNKMGHTIALAQFEALPDYDGEIPLNEIASRSVALQTFDKNWRSKFLTEDLFEEEIEMYEQSLVTQSKHGIEEIIETNKAYFGTLTIAKGAHTTQLKLIANQKKLAVSLIGVIEQYEGEEAGEELRSKLYKFDLTSAIVHVDQHTIGAQAALDEGDSKKLDEQLEQAREIIDTYSNLKHASKNRVYKMKRRLAHIKAQKKYMEFRSCISELNDDFHEAVEANYEESSVVDVAMSYQECKSLRAPSSDKRKLSRNYANFTFDAAVAQVDQIITDLQQRHDSYQLPWKTELSTQEKESGSFNKYDVGYMVYTLVPELRDLESEALNGLKKIRSRDRSLYLSEKKRLRKVLGSVYVELGKVTASQAFKGGYAIDHVSAVEIFFKHAVTYDRSHKPLYEDAKRLQKGMERLD